MFGKILSPVSGEGLTGSERRILDSIQPLTAGAFASVSEKFRWKASINKDNIGLLEALRTEAALSEKLLGPPELLSGDASVPADPFGSVN